MKHFLCAFFTLLICFSLTACSTGTQSSSSKDTAASQEDSSLMESTNDTIEISSTVTSSEIQEMESDFSSEDPTEETASAKSTPPVHHNNVPSRPSYDDNHTGTVSNSVSNESRPESSGQENSSTAEENTVSSEISQEITAGPSEFSNQVIQLVNEQRVQAGLAPYAADSQLSADAFVRAKETTTLFDHTRPNGAGFETAVTVEWQTVGENIAWGQNSPESVMSAWMNSPGHRQNIMSSSFSKIGIGVAEKDGTLYWVQLFVG